MAKKAEVIITCDATTVKQVMEGLNREMDKAKQRRQQLQQQQQTSVGLTRAEEKELANLIKYENALNEKQQKLTGDMRKYGEVMKDLAGAKLKDLKKALQEGKNALNNMSARDPNREKLVRDLQRIKEQIDSNTGAIQRQQSAWGSLGTTLKNLVAYAGVFAMFNRIKGLFDDMLKKNKEFSDQLANVRKVSNLAMADISQLANNLSKIDSRTSLKGLMELSYTGAKLGFGNYGIEGLESFAKSAVKVQNALSEDMGQDAMTALSKMVEVMGLIPKMGVERAMDATGSAIFKLASTSTATGTNIVEFSKRLMGLANIAHITTPELLAIGSAADSMALMPEVAATAFNKLITAMQKQPNLIENALKIDKGTISDLYQAGKMTDAMVLVFEKMREKGGMNALMQSGVFKDLGSDGARLVAVMATMANRVDMLNAHLAVSRQAFEEGTAVAQEYAIQMDTAAAYSERAANIWEKAFVNPEGVDVVKELSKAWYEVSKSLTQNERIMFGVKLSLQGIILLLKTLLQLLPEIIFTLGIAGMASMWAKMKEGEGILASLTAWFNRLTAAQKAFFRAAGWVGLALTIFEVGKAIYDLAQKTKEAAVYMKDFNKSLLDLDVEFGKADIELKRYTRAIDEANMGTKQRMAAITNFNSKFGPYLKNLLTEKSTALEVANAYKEVTKALRAKLALQLKEKDINAQVLPREQWTAEKRAEYDKRAKEAGLGQYGTSWITGYAQDNTTKSVDAMIRDIGKRFYNLPQKVIDEIALQAKDGNTEFNNYGNIINSRYLKQANALLAANSYLRQDRSAQNALRRVNEKWKPEQAAMDAYLAAQQQDDEIQPLEPLPEKTTGKGGKAGSELKNKFKTAKEQAEGMIAKIDQWYNLQDATINEFLASGQITEDEAKKALETMKIARNMALQKARLAVASGEDTEWKKFYADQMSKMMVDHGEWSEALYQQIGEVDVNTLHDFLATFDGSEGMKRLDASSFFDSMRKKAAESKKIITETQAKAREELNKMLLKYEYFDKAARQFAANLIQLGALGTTAEQMAQGMEGAPNAEQTMDAVKSLLANVIQRGSGIYAVNPGDAQAVADMIRQTVAQPMTEADYLAGKTGGEEAKWFDLFPPLKDWMQNPEQHKRELEDFYNILLQAEQDYYSKRKQAYDVTKRQQEARFRAAGYIDQEKQDQQQFKTTAELKDAGIGATFMEQQGLGSIQNDPEVQAIQNRIYWREKEIESANAQMEATRQRQQQELEELQAAQQQELELKMAANATEEELDNLRMEHRQQVLDMEQQQNTERMGMEDLLMEYKTNLLEQEMALATRVSQEFRNRVNTINNLTKPIQEGAQNIGKKFGEMIRGVEHDSMTWADIWHSMAQAVGDSIIDMMAQYAQNMIMEKMMAEQSKSNAISKANVDVAAGIASGSAKTIGELGWWGLALIPVIAAALHGLLAAAFSTADENSSASTSTASIPKTKLVSGMLTYDKGNVQRFIGQDGKVYTATEEPQPKDGLITHPIATTVQGQPALVAENGPEIVVGRETTKAIMMNEPELIRYLANYEKMGARGYGYRPFDSGNVEEVAANNGQSSSQRHTLEERMVNGQLSPDQAQTLIAAISTFNQTVQQMQQKGIPCYINKYGQGGLIEEVKSGMKFSERYQIG